MIVYFFEFSKKATLGMLNYELSNVNLTKYLTMSILQMPKG